MMELLQHLKPSYWFSAHLHVKFAAVYFHNECHDSNKKCTKFLALDKILPRRKFMQVYAWLHTTIGIHTIINCC